MIRENFNDEWVYHEGVPGTVLSEISGRNKKNEIKVRVPHDAAIGMARDPEGTSANGYFQAPSCFYTKTFYIPEDDADKDIYFEFEGVYHNAFIYLNGSFAGKHPYGFSGFYIRATELIRFGEQNKIEIIIKNASPSARWYTGTGLYRNVNLMISNRTHFSYSGVKISTLDLEDDYASIRADMDLEHLAIGTRRMSVLLTITDEKGIIAAQNEMPVTMKEFSQQKVWMQIGIENPLKWNTKTPHLYTYTAVLKESDAVIDLEKGTFGIRKLQIDAKHGLRINGETVKLRGGCIHHENGIIGAEDFRHVAEVRIQKLKDAGYNAIRSAHNPIGRTLLDACDRYGMLVMDEFTDTWNQTKTQFDYGTNMTEWWEADLTSLVDMDFNHPSVIMYSIGNEIYETGNPNDVEWGRLFSEKIHALDPTRYTINCINFMLSVKNEMPSVLAEIRKDGNKTEALDSNLEINNLMNNLGNLMNAIVATKTAGEATEEAFAQVQVAGYNYATDRYESDVRKYPNRIIVGSETYPQELDRNWELVEKYPGILGDFSWSAWDYLGETGIGGIRYNQKQKLDIYMKYPYKAAYCGDFNLIGDRRPVSFWREIIWGLRTKPYIAVQPPEYYGMKKNKTNWSMTDAIRNWNWTGYIGAPIIVEVYGEAEEAELFINSSSVGRKKVGAEKTALTIFNTEYRPGNIEAVTYKNGIEIGRDQIITSGTVEKLSAIADRRQIPSDGSDIAFIDISICDENGILNPDITQNLSISIEGPAEIIGFGSANPKSEENYFDREIRTYEGRAKAAIRANGEPGIIKVHFQTETHLYADEELEAVQ